MGEVYRARDLRLEMIDALAPSATAAIHYPYAIVHHYLGDTERMLYHMEQMVEHHAGASVFIAADRCLATLRGDPRYDALVRRVGVSLAHTASAPHTALR